MADIDNGAVHATGPDFVHEDFARAIGAKSGQTGDVLLTTKGTVGRVAILPDIEDRIVYSPQLCFFRVIRRELLEPRFLAYWFKSAGFILQSSHMQSNTDMAPYISLTDLKSVRIDLPTLKRQRAIAEVLGALDDKIAANAKLIDLLLAVVNTEFVRRFGDRSLEVTVGTLAEVVDCLHSKKPERMPDGATLMQLNNIRDDGLVDRTSTYCVSAEDYVEWSRRFETRAWDLVITNVGRVGAVARIPDGYVAALGRNMTGIRPKDAAESGSFISAALLSRAVRREIDRRTDPGSVMSTLNVRSVPLLRLQGSSPSERNAFHEFASPFFESADAALSENASLAATRDALLPQLVSGKVRVRDAERTLSEVL
ncbi:restriction endonuclease subunit S [Marisediminicola antarctica]|uniref:restriction endonuclease subunit S n=1 Tax=Marisediminicola antarctica TaxID=674079 RepID=UPI001F02DA6F